MLGEFEAARSYFTKMRQQALPEENSAYVQAAERGLARLSESAWYFS